MKSYQEKERQDLNINPGRLLRLWRKCYWFFSVYNKKAHDSVILTKNGLLKFRSTDKTTGRILHVYRQHEFDEIVRVMEKLISLGKLKRNNSGYVLDIGGYLGMSSTAFLLEDYFSKSIAIEASPINYKYLLDNIELNNLSSRFKTYNLALSSENGEVELEIADSNFGDNRVRSKEKKFSDKFNENKRNTVRITKTKFDSFLEQNQGIEANEIKLIWMDIQGHEPGFIAGAREFLKKYPEVPICMEFWPYAMQRSGEDINGFLDFMSSEYTNFIDMNEGLKTYKASELSGVFTEVLKHSELNNDPGYGKNFMFYNA